MDFKPCALVFNAETIAKTLDGINLLCQLIMMKGTIEVKRNAVTLCKIQL